MQNAQGVTPTRMRGISNDFKPKYRVPKGVDPKTVAETTNACLQGIRDLDLALDAGALSTTLRKLSLDSPVQYVNLEERALLGQAASFAVIRETATASGDLETLTELDRLAAKAHRTKQILSSGFSALDIGLFRGLKIEQAPDRTKGELRLVLFYSATTDQCPHTGGLEAAFFQATTELFHALKAIPGLNRLADAEIQRITGKWKPTDMSAAIRSAATGRYNTITAAL